VAGRKQHSLPQSACFGDFHEPQRTFVGGLLHPVAGLAAAALLILGAVTDASAGGAVTFTLTNGTDSVIDAFYASPPGNGDWEEDILGQDVLGPGESANITIDDGAEDCHYDFLAVFDDGTELEHNGVGVCDGQSYTYQ